MVFFFDFKYSMKKSKKIKLNCIKPQDVPSRRLHSIRLQHTPEVKRECGLIKMTIITLFNRCKPFSVSWVK